MMSCDLPQNVDKPKGKHKSFCLSTWHRAEPGWADHLNRWFIRGVSITSSKIQHLFEPCSHTQQDSPGMSLQQLAGLEESGWEWDWDWQPGREREPSPRSYGAPPPAPASPWPVDALAPPRPSSCPPPPSAWRCSRSGPWCFLCCCRLASGESEDKEMSSRVAFKLWRKHSWCSQTHQPPQVWFSGKRRSASPPRQRSQHSVETGDKDVRKLSASFHTHKHMKHSLPYPCDHSGLQISLRIL